MLTAVVKWIESWSLDVGMAGSNPATAGQFPHSAELCLPRLPS